MPPVLLMDFTNVGNGIHTLKLQEGRISRRPSWSSVFSYNKLIDWRLEWQHLHSANIAIPGQRWWQSEGKRKNRSSSAFYCCVYCHLDSAVYFGIFVWFLDSDALVPCPQRVTWHSSTHCHGWLQYLQFYCWCCRPIYSCSLVKVCVSYSSHFTAFLTV